MQEIADTRLDEDVEILGSLFLRLSWLGRRRLEQELNAYRLTVSQYVALRCAARHEQGCTMSHLAETSAQMPATMTGVIDRLAERQLVSRQRDQQDRRAQRVVLTHAGRELLVRIDERKRAWMRQFAGSLSAEDRREMIRLAQRYLTAIEDTLAAS